MLKYRTVFDPTPTPPLPLSLPGVPQPELGSREQFPELTFQSYLAHAAISPAPLAVTRAAQLCHQEVSQLGAGAFLNWMSQRERLRSSVASLLSVPSPNVALSAGCTRSIIDVALALNWRRDERLVTFTGEFPANVIPWQQAARLRGGEVVLLEAPDPRQEQCRALICESLKSCILDGKREGKPVRYVAVSAVQFQTGLLMPLKEMAAICRENSCRLLVDGIQACGVVPLDLSELGVDAFFCGAHKWLLSLEGSGFCFISTQLQKELSPLTTGWTSVQGGESFLFQGEGHLRYDRDLRDDAAVFEGSTSNASGFAALEAGIQICSELGPRHIFRHVQGIHDALEGEFLNRGFSSLRSADPALRSCCLSLRPPKDISIASLASELRKRSVMVSTPDGLIRLAPHYSNSTAEVPLIVGALDDALSVLRADG